MNESIYISILLIVAISIVPSLNAFSIRKSTLSDEINAPNFPLVTLKNLLDRLKKVPAYARLFKGGNETTLINVGASYRNWDPFYEMPLNEVFPDGYRLIGYECDHNSAELLKEKRPDVTVREMCVGPHNIREDLRKLDIPKDIVVLKTDIDSVDAPVLDAILSDFHPVVIYSEIGAFDFPPPVDFALVKVNETLGRSKLGCWGMSINMADRIYRHHGYSIIGASHLDIMAVRTSVLFPTNDADRILSDRPTDPYFWYQLIKSPLHHHHWKGGMGSPFIQLQQGIYNELIQGNGREGFNLPAIQIRTTDKVMARVSRVVATACEGHHYVLALADRCCSPQWFADEEKASNCICDLQHFAS